MPLPLVRSVPATQDRRFSLVPFSSDDGAVHNQLRAAH